MKKSTVIIIDDERLAREEVKRSLADFSEFEIIGEAKNYDEAKEQIEALKPELIFLDIQMPGRSGLRKDCNSPLMFPNNCFHFLLSRSLFKHWWRMR